MQQALTAAQIRIADLEKQVAASPAPRTGAKRKLPFRHGQPLWSWAITSAAFTRTANSAAASVSVCTRCPLFLLLRFPRPAAVRAEAAFCRVPSRQQPAWLVGLCFFRASRICWVTIQDNLEDWLGPRVGIVGGNEPAVAENTEIVNNVFETNQPPSTGDQPADEAQSDSSLDPEADTSVANPDPGSEEFFASDDGGDFFGDDDSMA